MVHKNKKFKFVILGLLIIIVLVSVALLNGVIAGTTNAIKPTKAAIDPYEKIIEELQAELQQTDLPSDTRTLLEGKLNSIGLAATQRVEGLTNQPTRPSIMRETPQNVEGSKLPDGIDNNPSFSFSESEFTVNNEWRKTTPDQYYVIFAGFLTIDPNQGALYVLHNLPSGIPEFILYITPDLHGGVRVVAENNIIITIESTDGTFFYFNAVTDQYVNAQGTPFPATPTPFNSSPSTPIPYP